MENNNQSCPTCDKTKRRSTDFVCHNCYGAFVADSAKLLAYEGRVMLLPAWVKPKAAERLWLLEQELKEKQNEYKALQDQVSHETRQSLRADLKEKTVPEEVFRKALGQRARNLWGEKGGNRLHAEKKTLEARIESLKEVLANLGANSQAAEENPSEPEKEIPQRG